MKSKVVLAALLLVAAFFPLACGIGAGSGVSDRKAGAVMEIDLGRGVMMEFVWCPPGPFQMGSPEREADRDFDEIVRRVKMGGFWIAKTEVSQRQWEAVMEHNPSFFKGSDLPVECVSWVDCQRFINRVNHLIWRERGTVGTLTLPTEAQWEYAARAGSSAPYATGETLPLSAANYWDADFETAAAAVAATRAEAEARGVTDWREIMRIARTRIPGATSPVGASIPNAWGVLDMHGNVWEWCADWYGEYNILSSRPPEDPAGPEEGARRVSRGGGWDALARYCRSAFRFRYQPGLRYYTLGFRPVCEPPWRRRAAR